MVKSFITFGPGELVTLTRRVDKNWYEGRIGSRKGIFPASYVEVLAEPGEARGESFGLYYKLVTIVNYASSGINKLRASLNDDARVIIYDRHMFIVQATGANPVKDFWIKFTPPPPLFSKLDRYRDVENISSE